MNRSRIGIIAWMLAALIAVPAQLRAQVPDADLWRSFAEKLQPGQVLTVRLKTGERFKATLLQVSDDRMMLQPKTRAAVPPQAVAFADVQTLDVDRNNGMSVGKAIAIGASAAAGAMLTLMLFALTWAD